MNDVMPPGECDQAISKINEWLDLFPSDKSPDNIGSVIHKYNISHHESTWKARLAAKKVFSGIWETDKLLTSLDGMAISEPPERGRTFFEKPGKHTLHLDQGDKRQGLHAYQGAVYLEQASEKDYCLQVMENSHKYHQEFFTTHKPNPHSEFRRLKEREVNWYKQRGCVVRRIPVPQGGMVLWDSRTVHAGAPPMSDRESPLWRYVIFVCMGPASWASPADINEKHKSYKDFQITRHWPCNGVSLFGMKDTFQNCVITEMPDIAKTDEMKRLAGVMEYDFHDGQPNGPEWKPKWQELSF